MFDRQIMPSRKSHNVGAISPWQMTILPLEGGGEMQHDFLVAQNAM
jgi:hypothetical protein